MLKSTIKISAAEAEAAGRRREAEGWGKVSAKVRAGRAASHKEREDMYMAIRMGDGDAEGMLRCFGAGFEGERTAKAPVAKKATGFVLNEVTDADRAAHAAKMAVEAEAKAAAAAAGRRLFEAMIAESKQKLIAEKAKAKAEAEAVTTGVPVVDVTPVVDAKAAALAQVALEETYVKHLNATSFKRLTKQTCEFDMERRTNPLTGVRTIEFVPKNDWYGGWGDEAYDLELAENELHEKKVALGLAVPKVVAPIATAAVAVAAEPIVTVSFAEYNADMDAKPAVVAVAAPAASAVSAVPVKATYLPKAVDVSEIANADTRCTLSFRNLPWDILSEDIVNACRPIAIVVDCFIPRDKFQPMPANIKLRKPSVPNRLDNPAMSAKGGAFVKFRTHAEAMKVLAALQGNLKLRCSYKNRVHDVLIELARTDKGGR